MNVRAVMALGLVLVAVPGPGWSAVRVPCVDGARNEGATVFVGVREDVARSVGAPEPSMDIVSADLWSDRRRITATIRLADLAAPGPMALAGARYTFLFFPPGQVWGPVTPGLALVADLTPSGSRFVVAHEEDRSAPGFMVFEIAEVGPATGVVDVARDEIRITAPLTAWDGVRGPDDRPRHGRRLVDFVVDTRARWAGSEKDAYPGTTSDWAHSDGTVHVVGQNGCTR